MGRDLYDIAVIGAGIVGLTIAFRLVASGKSVLILDRKGMAEETSRGNAGALAFADIEPLASPGIMLKAPKWLFDPLGPLSLPLGYAPRMVPWMLRFFRASMPDKHAAAISAQAALMDLARRETEPLYAQAGLSHLLRRDGAIYLYEGAAQWKASLPMWALRERHGVVFEHVSGERLVALQPGLGASYTHGTFLPQWMTVSDPYDVAVGFGKAALSGGAVMEIGEVAALEPGDDRVAIALSDGRSLAARKVVIAAGAWSHRLAALLGDTIPLETERGYNTTLPPGAFDLKRQLVMAEDGYVITPLDTGLRIGGAVELGGLDRAPDFRRSEILLAKAEKVMPGLRTDGGRQWMGFRPSLPDSLPVIGSSSRTRSIFYAFGHGHLGLTQAGSTALLTHDYLLDRTPQIDLTPYRPERF